MKTTMVLVSAVLVFGLTGMAQAGTLIAGPLSPGGFAGDGCVCEIANVSTGDKAIVIQTVNKGGVIVDTKSTTIPAGATDALTSTVASLQYCKFLNTSATYFRATMTCTSNGAPVMTLPAR
jgi:hypothetical protein